MPVPAHILGAICFKFPLPAGTRLAQSVERKALNLVIVSSSPTVGVAAGPTQWLSAVNLRVPVPECLWHMLEPAWSHKSPQNFPGPEKIFSAILSSRALAHTRWHTLPAWPQP